MLLLLPAMSPFDAVNHAFATLATGGFSTENGSVGQYGSAYVDWVITGFMVLAGMNFALHYQLLHRNVGPVLKNEELRVYAAILAGATVLLTLSLWSPTSDLLHAPVTLDGEIVTEEVARERAASGAVADESARRGGRPHRRRRDRRRGRARRGPRRPAGDGRGPGAGPSSATTPSPTPSATRPSRPPRSITTTGFGTADYELWPPLAIVILFALFFVGGMAGSTGGGVKVVRVLLILKNSFRELRQLVHPQAILPIRLDHRVVPEGIMRNVLSFIVFYVGLIGLGTLVMGALGLDIWSAFSATFSCVGNVGPAFGAMGPTENYTHVPAVGKWVLALLMMAGRLEIFTVLLLFTPAFWKR